MVGATGGEFEDGEEERLGCIMEPIDPCTLYALLVTSGAEVAGPHVRAACRRHLADMEAAKDPVRGIWFDVRAAGYVFEFFETRLRYFL